MDTEIDEQTYKGFDLTAYSEPEKVKALINHLELDGETDTIVEGRNDEYSINQRKVKRGDSPKQYFDAITNFKLLLTSKQRDKINSYLKLLGEIEAGDCKVRDKLYKQISKAVELKKDTEEYKVCKKHGLYVVNILYHLLWLPDRSDKETPDYVTAYREAWFGRMPKDFREFSDEDDGEYRVLTDDEADSAAESYFDSEGEYMWREAVRAENTMSGYDDWVKEVISNDGRGSLISSYDGCENEEKVDDEWYYIYRTG